MSPTPATANKGADPKALANRPENKLPPIPKGSRIQKRPLPGPPPFSKSQNTLSANVRTAPATEPDGYTLPPRATHTVVIKVASSASFMSLVRRVRKALEKGPPQKTKGLALAARVAALDVRGRGAGGQAGPVEDALDDVVLVATGRAIQRAVEVGAFFTRERDLVVLARTRTLRAIDDVVAQDEEADVEDQVRVRNLSCVEVGIRWAV
ncbi:hypothetical protein BT67DRAFT_423729 [Trichocladium antarcticum]|uniref:Uncharacterized protein n=1 Tax=Trichocladium antarcticum TaxID=1450529 RepID=A0AAN6ZD93_9PEZI|nr:hypothetical protein BT67DRAFT_423729 [Trichocladium antarcticum]